MSTTGGTEQGTVLVLDEPDVIRRKFKRAVTDSGREIVRAADKPGISNLIEILAVARGISSRGRRARVRRGRLRRLQVGRRRGSRRVADAGARALRRAARRRGARSRPSWPPAPRRRARSPRPSWPTCATAMGVGPARSVGSAASVRPMAHLASPRARPRRLRGPVRPAAHADPERGDRPARGPPGRDRARLPRAPRGARRAGPRGGDRVPDPDRRAARAEVAADAARARRWRGSTSSPARRPRSCSRGCSSTAASAARPSWLHERARAESGLSLPRAPLPPALRRVAARGRQPGLRARARSAEAIGGAAAHAAAARPPPRRARPRVSLERPPRAPARAAARARQLHLRRGGRGRRPHDRGRHAVRAARAATRAARPAGEQREPFGPIEIGGGGAPERST